MAEKKKFKLRCLICGEEKGLAKVKRIWKGPSCTEFAEDLSYTDRCTELRGGVFFKYYVRGLIWGENKTLERAADMLLPIINTVESKLMFVCSDCCYNSEKAKSRKTILKAKEEDILKALIKSEEEDIVCQQKHIDKEKEEKRQTVQRIKRIQKRLESLDN